ncbi:MAG: efflux RND transporter periplasmic adaptor subunit [Bacteroidales bacterium]|nr:efflux RND transporter periplasmic adaptor subunit [Bacteroidales bacterium]
MKQPNLPTIGCAFALCASLLGAGCTGQRPQLQPREYRVKIAQVQHCDSIEIAEFAGMVKEAQSVNLAFRVGGAIMRIHVIEGQQVRKGQPVAEMDPRDYALQLSATQAEYDKAMDEINRVKALYERQSVAEADYQKAKAGELLIQAHLKRANDQMADTKLYAPFDGYIQRINYRPGELVNIGMPVASIINVEQYHVGIEVPAALFVLRHRFHNVSCTPTIGRSEPIALEPIGHEVMANSNRLYPMTFRLNPRANRSIVPGMEVKVQVAYRPEAEQRTSVPADAVFNADGQVCVWVFNPADSTIAQTAVTPDQLAANGTIIINEGLSGNEFIITAGVHSLSNGLKVVPIAPKAATNIGGLL